MVQYSHLLFGSLSVIIIILFSLSVHEFAHAAVANLFGDPTARNAGRLSLNPLRHWDPIGTTMLVVLIALRSLGLGALPVFGWGKPVPVNEGNFDNPKLHGLQTALAGPMSNFILAALIGLVVHLIKMPPAAVEVLRGAIYINLFLMFFNLLPIPPLDGSRILRLFISEQAYYALASNPIFLFGSLFIVFFVLADWLVSAAAYLTMLLAGG